MPADFKMFLSQMEAAGYEINNGKHLAFKGKKQKKFIRLRSLGEGYSKVFLLSRPVSKQLLDIVREQVLLISCFAADSPIKYQ